MAYRLVHGPEDTTYYLSGGVCHVTNVLRIGKGHDPCSCIGIGVCPISHFFEYPCMFHAFQTSLAIMPDTTMNSCPLRLRCVVLTAPLLLAMMLTAVPAHRADAQPEPTYTERYRPQYHFTPAVNWTNDPNGLVWFDDEYHLFYQYNPFGARWGHMSWGHAVSPDLLHWEHLPVAIPETDSVMAFSGSAVVDWNNTSGFGTDDNPPMIAIYTGHYRERSLQAQYIAWSTDRGRTWTPYEGNPVLDLGLADFRDPKVFWYAPEEKWVMVVALSVDRKVHFYSSKDLKSWTFLSEFGPAGNVTGIWECPDLFELPIENRPGATRWVLDVDNGGGAVAGGSGGQYFVGHFDGTTFVAEHTDTRWVDYAKDFYAAISWSDVPEEDGRRLWVGWLNNWLYAGEIPTDPWRSGQSLPRALTLRADALGDLWLVQKPVEELKTLRETHRRLDARAITEGEHDLTGEGIAGKAIELVVELEVGDAAEVGLKVRQGEGEETVIGYDVRRKEVFVDRYPSGEKEFHPTFADLFEASMEAPEGRVKLHVFVDWSSVEVFADDGAIVFTSQVFPSPDSEGVSIYAEGGEARLVSLDMWTLASVW